MATYNLNIPYSVKGSFPEFNRCDGTAFVEVTSFTNVTVTLDQVNGTYCATPINVYADWSFTYKIHCKKSDCFFCYPAQIISGNAICTLGGYIKYAVTPTNGVTDEVILVAASNTEVTAAISGSVITITVPTDTVLTGFRIPSSVFSSLPTDLDIVVQETGTDYNLGESTAYFPSIEVVNRSNAALGGPSTSAPFDQVDKVTGSGWTISHIGASAGTTITRIRGINSFTAWTVLGQL